MSFDQVFDDSESKPRPAQVSGTSAVDTVEAFKKQVQIANAAVSESQKAFERVGWWPRLLIAAVIAALIPQVIGLNGFQLQVAINALLLAILALGLNVSVGWAGLLDLGYIAFYGFGAYGYAMLASPKFGLHWNLIAILPIVVIATALLGLLVALPALIQWLVVAVGNDVLDLGLRGNDAVNEGVPVAGIGPTPHDNYKIGGVVLNSDQIAVFVVAAIAAIVLWFVIRRWSVCGIPLPRALAPRGDSYEFVEAGRFHFHVEIVHPFTGLIVRYRGWLVAQA